MGFVLKLIFVFFISYASIQANKYSNEEHCSTDEDGNEHCYKEEEDEPCFYEDPEERLFQWDPVEV